ncbi:MAG TPA: helix-turn-helix transcriptional regulator [Chloroflexia bacterium]|nr:helix-turn-helix transcriptional regulator [Chloroflexia bacterium]
MGRYAPLAQRIKDLRHVMGFTQQDLSRASGLSRSYISRLEMGDIALPSRDKIRSLAHALGTTLDDLLQAAGFLDMPEGEHDLPDIKVYLRRKYGIDDHRLLQAIESIVQGLQSSSGPGTPTVTSHVEGSSQVASEPE